MVLLLIRSRLTGEKHPVYIQPEIILCRFPVGSPVTGKRPLERSGNSTGKMYNNYREIYLHRLRRGWPRLRLLPVAAVLGFLLIAWFSGVAAYHRLTAIHNLRRPPVPAGAACRLTKAAHWRGLATAAELPLVVVDELGQRAPELPEMFRVAREGQGAFIVHTTVVAEIQQRLTALFRRYHPLAGAGVVLDPDSGAVLAMADYQREAKLPPSLAAGADNLCLFAGFPAASLIKIVTAAGAIERKGFTADRTLPVSGRNHTLYRHQLGLKAPRFRSRPVSLENAFARSINPFFGLLGVEVLTAAEFADVAADFLFLRPLGFDLPVSPSRLLDPATPFARAELASGFNTHTTISPLHAALVAGAAVTDGRIMRPYVVQRLVDDNGVEVLYRRPRELAQAISPEVAREIGRLMQATVERGTARKSFCHLSSRCRREDWRLGGKTGNIDLRNNDGRCEWFAGYGTVNDRRIAVAVVLVHGDRRTIGTAYVAAELIKTALLTDRESS
jgi:cell division protein FtsI/penicillin-binding protein 2